MSKFSSPVWEVRSIDEIVSKFSLEVLKDGAIVSTVPLHTRTHYIAGRQPDVCDIQMDHPSISREHAAIVNGEDGCLFIVDLDSAQKTLVNKKPLTSRTFERLFVGDMVRFGVSTRMYIVCGPDNHRPPEYDSANLQRYREQLKKRSMDAESRKREQENSGISWGFREDAPADDSGDEEENGEEKDNLPSYIKRDENYDRKYGKKFSADIDESEVNEKDRAVLEKIRAKEKKIQNMQEENRRIYMKEASQEEGLTAGQQACVSRNDNNIEKLKEEIDELEKLIKSKNENRAGISSSATESGARKRRIELDDDDDLLDTTLETADASTNWRMQQKLTKGRKLTGATEKTSSGPVLTYEGLLVEVAVLTERLESTRSDINRFSTAVESTVDTSTSIDDFDAYILESTKKEDIVSLQKLRILEEDLEIRLRRSHALLKIATPSIPSLIKTPFSKTTDTSNKEAVSTSSVEVSARSDFASHTLNRQGQENGKRITPSTVQSPSDAQDFLEYLKANSGKLSLPPEIDNVINIDQAQQGPVAKKTKSATQPLRCEKSHEMSLTAWSPGNGTGAYADGWVCGMCNKDTSSQPDSWASERYCCEVCESDCCMDCVIAWRHSRSGASAGSNKRQKVVGPSMPDGTAVARSVNMMNTAASQMLNVLEGGDTVWVPPQNQKGDGKTHLNDKYGY